MANTNTSMLKKRRITVFPFFCLRGSAHKKMRYYVVLFFLAVFCNSNSFAGDCKKTGSVCVDSTPCKTVSGQPVCLSQFGLSCWEYEDTYTCIKPNAVNYCQPFVDAQPACWQTSSQCSQWDSILNSGCMKYTQTWRCSDPSKPAPSNTIKLDTTYTLVSSGYDPGPCQSLSNNANCSLAQSDCVQTSPDEPLPPGIDPNQAAPDGCYRRTETYACVTGAVDTSECDSFANDPNCSLQSTSSGCDEEDILAGKCLYQEKTYKCMTNPGYTQTVEDCSGQVFCQDGNCFDKGYAPDTNFALSQAMMEAARQAGTYTDGTYVFTGADSRCRIKLFGLANCCKSSSKGSSFSNNMMMQLAGQVGSNVFSYGSRYMYDQLFANSNIEWLQKGASKIFGMPAGQSALSSFSPSISLFGLTVSYGKLGPGIISNITGGLGLPGAQLLNTSGPIFGLNFYFDPTMFAIQIGMMLIQDLLSCDQDEGILAMRRGQNLCTYVGQYCSQRINVGFAKICVEHTKSYCCFNSRLARIINEQGRAQIGKGWGSSKNPDCSGFTADQIAMIDFSKMDLSEFTSEIMANIQTPDLSKVMPNIQGVVDQKVQNYYQTGSQ